MSEHFAIARQSVVDRAGRSTVLRLSGEFDLAARDALREAMVRAAASGSGVTVDLGAVTFLDSESLGALVDGYHAARLAGAGFRLVNARGAVLRVLEVTGMLTLGDPDRP